jgi:hypothetical protein
MAIELRDTNSRVDKSSGAIEVDRILTDPESTSETPAKNGLQDHLEASLTPEEIQAEKKFRLKIDFIILPIIATIYFLAALVSLCHALDSRSVLLTRL